MTIMASAPVPAQCRLDEAKTVRLHPMTDRSSATSEIRGAAAVALAAWAVRSRQEAAELLLSWRRRAEMTEADVTAVLAEAFPETTSALACFPWCISDHDRHPDVPLHQSTPVEITARDAGAYDAPATAALWVEHSEDDCAPGEPEGPRLVLSLHEGTKGGFPTEPATVAWSGTPEQAEALARELLHAANTVRADHKFDDEGWARTFIADRSTDPRLRGIVADLLRQVEEGDR